MRPHRLACIGKLTWGKRAYALLLLFVAIAIALPAQTFTTLHSFDSTDGSYPYAGLVQATNGDLYGTTEHGGANGYGTVFKITPSGTLTTVHSFCSVLNVSGYCTDGQLPSGLIQATDGDFYGTTAQGGANDYGTVFEITASGALTTLHNFDLTDGYDPVVGLVQATNGDFFGTTYYGGANGFGTVFKMTQGGTLTTLYSFCAQSSCTDGEYPGAVLIQATNGDFYGITYAGGTGDDGTVFRITPSGALTTLHSFDGFYDPVAGLVQATNGNFYGTTEYGGTGLLCGNYGCGTVFKITASGTLTTQHSFDLTDGANPYAGLVQATNGDFYGTAEEGGANDYGSVFRITPSGTLTTLHSFASTDGAYPYAGLVEATNGDFYGTTYQGGADTTDCGFGCGTVFRLSVGLGPFVETQTTSGKVGAAVKILGTNLTGATSVTFNGTGAVFRVASASLITTTVPAGATTGTVQVVTPSGTLSSNVPFRVP